MAAESPSAFPHIVSEERFSEVQAEAARLIESVRRLKATRIDFDVDPRSFDAALRNLGPGRP